MVRVLESEVSLTHQIASYFRERPSRWIDGKDLAKHFGGYGWRTRVSECRTELGMTVENRVRRVKSSSGLVYAISEYRYLPAEVGAASASASADDRFDANAAFTLQP